MTLRAPTLAELAVIIRDLPDGCERARLEDLYWAKATSEHGALKSHWHRQEYEWLRQLRRPRPPRLEELLACPALGAFRMERRAA